MMRLDGFGLLVEDMAKMIFRMGFNLDEPRYGWQGFDDDVFSDVLSDNLQK